ncbi:hypothetical protein ACNKU7_15065 [Microbulbifer sp. SA54]
MNNTPRPQVSRIGNLPSLWSRSPWLPRRQASYPLTLMDEAIRGFGCNTR